MASHDAPATVAGSWRTSGAGWLLSGWSYLTAGMAPLAAALALATLVLTAIKIVQEVKALRKVDAEQSAIQKLLDRLARRSTFDELDKR